MNIPNSFRLWGQTISVVWHDDLFQEEGLVGMACYRKNEIHLQTGRLQALTEKTFWHEVFHFILMFLQEDARNIEKLVNISALCIQQVLETGDFPVGGKEAGNHEWALCHDSSTGYTYTYCPTEEA